MSVALWPRHAPKLPSRKASWPHRASAFTGAGAHTFLMVLDWLKLHSCNNAGLADAVAELAQG